MSMMGDFPDDAGRTELYLVDCQPEHTPIEKLGATMEYGANAISFGRGIGGIALSAYINNTPEYQSWKTAGAFLGLAVTDLEGKFLARPGRKLQHKEEGIRRPFNAYLDHLTDKTLTDSVLFAIGNREIKNGNAIYGKAVLAAAAVTTARDVITTADRIIADTQDLDTRAQKAGKLKAVKQYAVITFALSPLAKSGLAKTLLGVGLAYTSVESVRSGLSLHKSFQEQRLARRTKRQSVRRPSNKPPDDAWRQHAN